MHYGFAAPWLGVFIAIGGAWWALSPVWAKVVGTVAVVTIYGLLDGLARHVAYGQVRRWAEAQGMQQVTPVPRGGFVSWGLTLCTIAETNRYTAVDTQGHKVDILASYQASLLGVSSRCAIVVRDAVL